MKILQLTNKVPFPERDGGALGVSVFTRALLESGQQVKMLAMNTSRHFTETNSVPQKFKNETRLETVHVDTSIKPLGALIALLQGKSYNISRFFFNEFSNKLVSILRNETFDIVQLEGLYLAPYLKTIRLCSKAPVVLREHNIEWMIWERLSAEEKNILKKTYLRTLAKQLKKYEEVRVNLFDGITTTTLNDKKHLEDGGCKTPIAHIPFGINTAKYSSVVQPENNSLFYIGALDWLPNIQGLNWFLTNIWPQVYATCPDLSFHVAGRNMPEKYKTTAYKGVIFHGEVENAIDFMGRYNIMVVPLLAGSGIRVKIIEGMAMQKPVLTTSVGLEGIECKNETDVLVANTPGEFYEALIRLHGSPTLSQTIALNGRSYVETTHNINTITLNLVAFYKELISKKAAVN